MAPTSRSISSPPGCTGAHGDTGAATAASPPPVLLAYLVCLCGAGGTGTFQWDNCQARTCCCRGGDRGLWDSHSVLQAIKGPHGARAAGPSEGRSGSGVCGAVRPGHAGDSHEAPRVCGLGMGVAPDRRWSAHGTMAACVTHGTYRHVSPMVPCVHHHPASPLLRCHSSRVLVSPSPGQCPGVSGVGHQRPRPPC